MNNVEICETLDRLAVTIKDSTKKTHEQKEEELLKVEKLKIYYQYT